MTAKFAGMKAFKTKADVLATSSSRGGPFVDQGVMKPDLAAPGTSILAGNTGNSFPDPDDEDRFALPGDQRHLDGEPARGRRRARLCAKPTPTGRRARSTPR